MNLIHIGFSKDFGSGLRLVLGAALLSFTVSATALAQVTSPCDPQYMDALEARAWLEAQREITQNKNLIYKPDSVLEYTCFGGFLDEAASNFGTNRQFSETNRWSGYPSGFSSTTTDAALQSVVMAPFVSYLLSNFQSSGGKGYYLNNRDTNEYPRPQNVSGGRAYSCNQMQRVWAAARCENFMSDESHDGFYDFAWYQNNDPRAEDLNIGGWNLVCQTPDTRVSGARGTAYNGDQALFDVGTELNAAQGDGTPYQEDDVITHLNLILPTTGGNNCGTGIPTGIQVQRPDLGTYNEVVCPNPGCSSTQGGACQ